MADWRTDVIRAVGGRPSPNTLAFLQGWQRKEGGHTNNDANFNWLNRTGSGQYPTMNRVGVEVYPNYQTGVSRTADLIRSGYPAIYNALRGGQVSFQNPAIQGDLNRWLSGKRTPGMTPYVQSVARLSGMGGGGSAGTVGAAPAAPPPNMQPQQRGGGLATLMPLLAAISSRRQARQEGTRAPIGDLVGAILGMRQQRPEMPAQSDSGGTQNAMIGPPGASAGAAAANGFLQAPTEWAGTHVTSNLGWGTRSAQDIMSRPGTAVGAPEDGVIVRHGSAQGGESVYFRGASGKTYWLGHVANSLPPGTRVRRGQVITHISADHPRPHLHIDRR